MENISDYLLKIKRAIKSSLFPPCTDFEDLAGTSKNRRVGFYALRPYLPEISFGGLMYPRFQDLPDGLFTGASEKGTWVRLFHPPVEGKLIRGFEAFDVGDRVRVEP